MNIKKVLLVEDRPSLQYSFTYAIKSIFGEKTVVLVTGKLAEAEAFFSDNVGELDLILMDATIEDGETTFRLVADIVKVFKRPIVAMSSNNDDRKKMMELGCTHDCDKGNIVDFLTNWKES